MTETFGHSNIFATLSGARLQERRSSVPMIQIPEQVKEGGGGGPGGDNLITGGDGGE